MTQKPRFALATIVAGLEIILMVEAVAYIVAYGVLAIIRLRYPYELEWIEGAIIDSSIRLATGRPLYTAPSLEFVPLIYNPLYLYVSAGVMRLLGTSPVAPRLISFLASFGCMGVIYRLVQHETRDAKIGLISAGFYAATFKIAGAWFDIAKTDSLFVLLILAGVYCTRRWRTLLGVMGSAGLLTLAYFAKQLGIVVIVFMGLFYLFEGWKPFVVYTTTTVFLVGGATLALDVATHGWYTFYVFRVISENCIIKEFFYLFWLKDILGNVSIIAILSLLFLPLVRPLEKSDSGKASRFYMCAVASMLLMSWLGRLNNGGYLNALMPAFAAFAVLLGLLIHYAQQHSHQAFAPLALLLYVIQFGQLFYVPTQQLPSALDYAAGARFIETLKSFKGDVFVPYHGYYATLAGKPMHAQWAGLVDLVGAECTAGETTTYEDVLRVRQEMDTQIRQAIRSRVFDAIVLDLDFKYWTERMSPYYEKVGPVFTEPDSFWTRVGWRTRPQSIYVPRATSVP
jgi:hypothetical protein